MHTETSKDKEDEVDSKHSEKDYEERVSPMGAIQIGDACCDLVIRELYPLMPSKIDSFVLFASIDCFISKMESKWMTQ